MHVWFTVNKSPFYQIARNPQGIIKHCVFFIKGGKTFDVWISGSMWHVHIQTNA